MQCAHAQLILAVCQQLRIFYLSVFIIVEAVALNAIVRHNCAVFREEVVQNLQCQFRILANGCDGHCRPGINYLLLLAPGVVSVFIQQVGEEGNLHGFTV